MKNIFIYNKSGMFNTYPIAFEIPTYNLNCIKVPLDIETLKIHNYKTNSGFFYSTCNGDKWFFDKPPDINYEKDLIYSDLINIETFEKYKQYKQYIDLSLDLPGYQHNCIRTIINQDKYNFIENYQTRNMF